MKKVLKVPSNTSILVGVGSSICGGSAIAATAPVIDALFFLSVRSSARIAARRFRSRVGRRCPDDSVEKRGEWMKGAKAKRLQFGTK